MADKTSLLLSPSTSLSPSSSTDLTTIIVVTRRITPIQNAHNKQSKMIILIQLISLCSLFLCAGAGLFFTGFLLGAGAGLFCACAGFFLPGRCGCFSLTLESTALFAPRRGPMFFALLCGFDFGSGNCS